jgi:glutathione S-transferase
MIDLHYWTTANGHKVTMFLEEAGLPYRIVPVNISKAINSSRNSDPPPQAFRRLRKLIRSGTRASLFPDDEFAWSG